MMESNIENLHPKGQAGIEPGTFGLLAMALDHSATSLLGCLKMY